MQRRPKSRDPNAMRMKRTQPALPGATLSTVPVAAPFQQYPPARAAPQKRQHHGRGALIKLLCLGVLLEALFLALYPLLAHTPTRNDTAEQAVLGIFPWIPRLYWTTAFPALVQLLSRVPVFNLSSTGSGNSANANVLLLLLGLTFLLVLIAARIGNRVVKQQVSRANIRSLFCMVIIFTGIFGLTYLCAPGGASQDMFLYGFYGRLVTTYHVNPYVVPLAAFPHDMLHMGILKNAQGTASTGPVWIDLSIPVTLFAGESVANVLLGFRLLGLFAHFVNALLIWVILARLKPETRLAATLLYAWNPLVLLLSVCGMHVDIVIALFLLLAILFFQRKLPFLGWIFLLVASLTNLLCLLLLPLFFRFLSKEFRTLGLGRRVLAWFLVICVSALIVVLAYAPYWQDWGIAGVLASVKHTFLQDSAVNSLDAAVLNLPIKLPPALSWLVAPHHWTLFALVTVGSVLLLGTWLADTVELVVLFSSWVFLALLILLPTYWPWYMILPLTLTLCSAHRRIILLALLLAPGALLSYYFWLWQPAWPGQALVSVGLPLLMWGWLLFFTSTWEMSHANEVQEPVKQARGLSRPSWPYRAAWPSRPSLPPRKR